MLTTSQTATSWMFSVLANTTMAVTDVASQLSGVAESGRHCRDSKLLVDEFVVMGQAVRFDHNVQHSHTRFTLHLSGKP